MVNARLLDALISGASHQIKAVSWKCIDFLWFVEAVVVQQRKLSKLCGFYSVSAELAFRDRAC